MVELSEGSHFLFERDTSTGSVTSSFDEKSSATTLSTASESQTSSINKQLDSHGCVICSTTPSCPVCGDNQQCAMTTQTCSECPTTYCLNVSESINSTSQHHSLSSAAVGGIAGGLGSFVFILLLAGAYIFIRKFKNRLSTDYDFAINEEMKMLNGFDDDDAENYDIENEGALNHGDLFNGKQAIGRRPNQPYNQSKRLSQNSISTMANSVFTKASNVLNIGYVPGVTIARPTKPTVPGRRATRKPTASMYSKGMSVYSKETYFSDLENASFHGGNVATRAGHPTLVEIKHDDYDFDDEYEEDGDEHEREHREGEDADDEDDNFPIRINFQLPSRRVKEDDIIEEDEDTDEERGPGEPYKSSTRDNASGIVEEETDDEAGGPKGQGQHADDEDDDGVNLNIALSDNTTSNPRTVPTRYAALIEKKDRTNHAQPDGSVGDPFSHRYDAPRQHHHPDVSTDSYSESSSDSDEENIEYLLQANGHGTGSNAAGTVTTYLGTGSTTHDAASNPFSSPLD